MDVPMIGITSPVEGATVGTGFNVNGTCSANGHTVTVNLWNASNSYENTAGVSNGAWATSFSGVVAGTYDLKATCAGVSTPTITVTVE